MEQAGGDEPIDTLADLAAALHDHAANTVRLALATAALADRGDWALDGSVSMTAWLRAHLRMLDNDAHELLRAGRFYTRSAPFAAAVTHGTLSAGQATLMRRAIRPDTEAIFDQQHTELVDILAPLDLAQTKIACRTWRARADAITDPEPRPVAPTELSHAIDDNGHDAEFAILVSHYVNGMGLGRHLMRRLVRWAKGRKVQRIYGEVLESNLPMQALAASLGFQREYPGEPGMVRMVLDLPPPKPKLPPPPPGMGAAGR